MKVTTINNSYSPRGGFTLVEILLVLGLVGMVALPFTNMFLFGYKGSSDNVEYVLAYNLAREKMEELKGLPFGEVKSDYDNFRNVFRDRMKYDEAYYNETSFINYFSDVFTEKCMEDSELKTTFDRLTPLYPKSMLKDLIKYPNDYHGFRRVVTVERAGVSAMPPRLKKVRVMVFDITNKKIAEIATMIGKHK